MAPSSLYKDDELHIDSFVLLTLYFVNCRSHAVLLVLLQPPKNMRNFYSLVLLKYKQQKLNSKVVNFKTAFIISKRPAKYPKLFNFFLILICRKFSWNDATSSAVLKQNVIGEALSQDLLFTYIIILNRL